MKFLLTLLIAIMPMVADGQGILATAADTGNTTRIISDAVNALAWDAWTFDTVNVWPSLTEHDTTKEYVHEIADKCDTTWGKHWVKYKKIDGEQYFKRMAKIDSVHCYIDTVWADKKLVYFTPDEVNKLQELID